MAKLQKLAIIDLGSNTTRLVVFHYIPGKMFRLTDQISERVRLSEGMGDANLLQAQPMQRAIDTLRMFKAFCRANDIEDIVAVGTSAVRDAVNQRAFLSRLEQDAGINLRVLSGTEEAYYAYLGMLNSLDVKHGIAIDQGGGSVEMISFSDRHLTQMVSLPLGTVRLTEGFIQSNPINKEDYQRLDSHIRKLLAQVNWYRPQSQTELVTSGGTIRALVRMDRRARKYPLDRVHGYYLPYESVVRIEAQVRALPVAKRSSLPGLKEDRADIVLAGVMVVKAIMELGRFDGMTVSGQGIREGLFYERFLPDDHPPLFPDIRRASIENLARMHDQYNDHALHVRYLSLQLFDQLREIHGLGTAERELLAAAALVHDIGMAIDYYEHHEHSAYLILNADLQGYTHREVVLLAQISRYHRRGKPEADDYTSILRPGDEARLVVLTALLRLAEYLERGRTQVISDVYCHITARLVQIEAQTRGDASVELWEADRNTDLLESALGREVEILAVPQPLQVV